MSVFGVNLVRISSHLDRIRRDTRYLYSVRMLENADQNNSKYEHFLRSVLNEFKQIFETIPNNFYLRCTLLFKDFWDNNLDLFIPLIQWQINTAQKMKFSIKDFFSKCDQIGSFLWIWSHLLKKSLMKNLIFCAVYIG